VKDVENPIATKYAEDLLEKLRNEGDKVEV
jgi:hypothetical protein